MQDVFVPMDQNVKEQTKVPFIEIEGNIKSRKELESRTEYFWVKILIMGKGSDELFGHTSKSVHYLN